MQPLYSTMAFIETLRSERHGLVTRLIDPISGAAYGYMFQMWPVIILRIDGWHGERITVLKLFEREFVW